MLVDMKKGFAIPTAGIMLMLFSIVILAIMVTIDFNEEVSVIRVSDIAISFSHESEMVDRIQAGSVDYAAHEAMFELGKLGGGEEWKTGLTLDSFVDDLENAIGDKMVFGEFPGSSSKREINLYEPTNIKVIDYDGDSFTVTGVQSFELTDSELNGLITRDINYDSYIETSYFGLITAGIDAFNQLEGGVDLAAVKADIEGREYYGLYYFEIDIVALDPSGNSYEVTLKDLDEKFAGESLSLIYEVDLS
jgi:hypothetical protein